LVYLCVDVVDDEWWKLVVAAGAAIVDDAEAKVTWMTLTLTRMT
jgi:hypothetical protein